jgi:hypothetical protein
MSPSLRIPGYDNSKASQLNPGTQKTTPLTHILESTLKFIFGDSVKESTAWRLGGPELRVSKAAEQESCS